MEDEDDRFNECEYCDEKSKQLKVLFSGDLFGKWGTGQMICKSCLKEQLKEPLLAFKCHGRLLYYDWLWIYRWKNPHGNHRIFNEAEIDRLGGTYPPNDYRLSEEDISFMREKVLGYLATLTAR
jgi:hypothetical protein